MPYKILRIGKYFRVINSQTGKVHAEHTTKHNAEAQVRLLKGLEYHSKRINVRQKA
jgi:hypothetical protein